MTSNLRGKRYVPTVKKNRETRRAEAKEWAAMAKKEKKASGNSHGDKKIRK